MQRLGQIIPGRVKPKATTKQVLMAAYQAVFSGNATRQDADIVVADLASFTGFYQVTPSDYPGDQIKFREGQRSVFLRIFDNLRKTETEIAALQEAARAEGLTIYQE